MRYNFLIILIISILFISCEEEVTRVDLYKNRSPEIMVDCEKHRQVDFYLDCDMTYEKVPSMVMDFEFYKGKNQLLKGGLDPLAVTQIENETKTTSNGKTHWKFYGKLEGNFIPPEDTIFTIKPTLIMNSHPSLKIDKFELVLVR